jgi:exodeoxyribonuclease V
VTTLELSQEQEIVLDEILDWRSRDPKGANQILTLGGYAGTGKTTLISFLAQAWDNVAVAAYCGKAAHVLRSKGVEATTIHSLIYVKFINRFCKRRILPCVSTLIIDEASMIDHVTCADLRSFELPILFAGDHGQLEPIGTSAELMVNPMLRLEKIHRQAMGHPILRLATAFREGRKVPFPWDDPKGMVRLVDHREFGSFVEGFVSADKQIICGYNKTRHQINRLVRQLMDSAKHLITPGEKLICLQNNKTWGLFNGQLVTVLDIVRESRNTVDLEVETDDGRYLVLPCLRLQFGQDLMKDFKSKEAVLMDYGYALTAHKAQGSEWESVLVLEEIWKCDPRRWRYTVTTRARKHLVYCR